MEGGAPGSKNYTKILFADGSEPDVFGKTAQYHLKKGDVAQLITGTGIGPIIARCVSPSHYLMLLPRWVWPLPLRWGALH